MPLLESRSSMQERKIYRFDRKDQEGNSSIHLMPVARSSASAATTRATELLKHLSASDVHPVSLCSQSSELLEYIRQEICSCQQEKQLVRVYKAHAGILVQIVKISIDRLSDAKQQQAQALGMLAVDSIGLLALFRAVLPGRYALMSWLW